MIVINNLFVLDSAYASDWPFGRLQHCPGKSNFCDRRFCPILDNRAKWLAHVQLSKWPILFWTCRSVKQIDLAKSFSLQTSIHEYCKLLYQDIAE